MGNLECSLLRNIVIEKEVFPGKCLEFGGKFYLILFYTQQYINYGEFGSLLAGK